MSGCSNVVKLIDSDHESVTVAWPVEKNVKSYELSVKTDGSDEWKVLSDKLQGNMTRKKNLSSSEMYIFRVRYVSMDGTVGEKAIYSAPLAPLDASLKQPKAPTLVRRDGVSVTIGWDEVEEAVGYQIQYRCVVSGSSLSEEDNLANITWVTIPSTVSGTSVRKKNLLVGRNYFFRVKPVMVGDNVFSGAGDLATGSAWAPSVASEGFSVAVLAQNIRRFMPPKLLSPSGALVETGDQLAGKVIGIYFSAHWCGPCRQFTPQLVSVYQQAKKAGLDFEVVFCSADHGEGEFDNYFKQSMANSWCAVPYDASQREDIQGLFKVNGIPRLVILSAATGRIVVDNVLEGGGITVEKVAQWVAAEMSTAKK